MSSEKNGAQELSDGWVVCCSKSNPGRKYYFNKKTGKSSWTQPQAEDNPGQSKEKNVSKEKKIDKFKKEEAQKKTVKRKSDGQESSPVKKKPKQDSPSKNHEKIKHPSPLKHPEKKYLSPSKHRSDQCKQTDSIKNQTPPQTLKKNLANTRLSQLRSRLSEEANQEECSNEPSPAKPNKQKLNSKTSQHEPPSKIMKVDSKSPVLNDSKCSTTTQSPSSDSIQSIPSPSQFFAANKIISSMKSQLPEHYCDKTKQKDTFADIEEGICKQTTEYPFMKHPATPPQFSEASKLVSAIKSKLSYKVASKDTNVETFRTAQDRMNTLRVRLSNESVTSDNINNSLSNDLKCLNEAMDIDCKEVNQSVPVVHSTKDNLICNKDVVLVVDTNIFIHELDFIQNVLNSHIKGYDEQPTLLVPWRVINELDRLKDNNNGNGALCKRAKSAMDYLYKSLPENNRIKGQSLRDANSHIYPCEIPDDEILNCCLQQAERGKSVILVSNDKNLCNKARINGVKSTGIPELRRQLAAPPRAPPPAAASLRQCRDALHHLLATILENEMRAKYNNLWQHVLFKAPPWSLDDVLQCLKKHWIAVFNEVFPRVVEHLLTDLRSSLLSIESKDSKSVSPAEVANFQELTLEIARKCQIIPEYMELAKLTVERLQQKDQTNDDGAVVETFEALWTVFSSYCAKLSSALGIPHNFEDNLPGNEPLAALRQRAPALTQHLRSLVNAIQGILRSEGDGGRACEDLCNALSSCRTFVGLSGDLCARSLQTFACSCKNMLQEAHTKFAQLIEVLDACQRHTGNE